MYPPEKTDIIKLATIYKDGPMVYVKVFKKFTGKYAGPVASIQYLFAPLFHGASDRKILLDAILQHMTATSLTFQAVDSQFGT